MFWLFNLSAAHAHLIVSQRGTLNIVDNGAYMVLSLPVSAFVGIDGDGDGRLSIDELRSNATHIEAQVQRSVQLGSSQGVLTLEGVMLNTSPPENAPTAPADQIIVMGRFPLGPNTTALTFSLGLFGTSSAEQVEQITVTRRPETQLMTLTPRRPQAEVLPSAWKILRDQAVNGAAHVLGGADHLLFLLVVLATGWSFRKMVLALSCFTLGHAITLVGRVYFGLVVSPALVEPAIAATIVAMALFDRWDRNRRQICSTAVRMALVFGCALIHGLGLADALTSLGLGPDDRWLNLAGFNIGIELGQIAAALVVVATMHVIQGFRGPFGVDAVARLTLFASVLIGGFWFIERVMDSV